jgi:hypothetical protein
MLFGEYDATVEEEKMNPKTDRMMKTPIVHVGVAGNSPATIRVSHPSPSTSPVTASRISLFKDYKVGDFDS